MLGLTKSPHRGTRTLPIHAWVDPSPTWDQDRSHTGMLRLTPAPHRDEDPSLTAMLGLTPSPHRDQHPTHTSPSGSPQPHTAPWRPHIPLFSPIFPYFHFIPPLIPRNPRWRNAARPARAAAGPEERGAGALPSPGAIAAAGGEARPGPAMATDSWALAVDEQEAAAESVRGGRDRGTGPGNGNGNGQRERERGRGPAALGGGRRLLAGSAAGTRFSPFSPHFSGRSVVGPAP